MTIATEIRRRPGGEVANRPLHFIWIADCSGSMMGSKMSSLNTAIREALPHMEKVADENPNAAVLVRAIAFADIARWHVSQPTPLDEFKWEDLTYGGLTAMGDAFDLLAGALDVERMGSRALPPVLVLLSDGQPSDEWKGSLERLLCEPWAVKAVRLAIAIGDDADHAPLEAFIDNPEINVLQANNPETLVRYIRWVSTAVLQSASAPAVSGDDKDGPTTTAGVAMASVPIPTAAGSPIDAADPW